MNAPEAVKVVKEPPKPKAEVVKELVEAAKREAARDAADAESRRRHRMETQAKRKEKLQELRENKESFIAAVADSNPNISKGALDVVEDFAKSTPPDQQPDKAALLADKITEAALNGDIKDPNEAIRLLQKYGASFEKAGADTSRYAQKIQEIQIAKNLTDEHVATNAAQARAELAQADFSQVAVVDARDARQIVAVLDTQVSAYAVNTADKDRFMQKYQETVVEPVPTLESQLKKFDYLEQTNFSEQLTQALDIENIDDAAAAAKKVVSEMYNIASTSGVDTQKAFDDVMLSAVARELPQAEASIATLKNEVLIDLPNVDSARSALENIRNAAVGDSVIQTLLVPLEGAVVNSIDPKLKVKTDIVVADALSQGPTLGESMKSHFNSASQPGGVDARDSDILLGFYASAAATHTPESSTAIDVLQRYTKNPSTETFIEKATNLQVSAARADIDALARDIHGQVEFGAKATNPTAVVDVLHQAAIRAVVVENQYEAAAAAATKKSDKLTEALKPLPKDVPNRAEIDVVQKKIKEVIKNASPQEKQTPEFWQDRLAYLNTELGSQTSGGTIIRAEIKGSEVTAIRSALKAKIAEAQLETVAAEEARSKQASKAQEHENNKAIFASKLEARRKSISEAPSGQKFGKRTERYSAPVGTDKAKVIEKAMRIKLSTDVNDRFVRPLVEANRAGVDYKDLYVDVAKTISVEAVYGHLHPQEALDTIVHLASTDLNKVQDYTRSIRDVLVFGCKNSKAREAMVKNAKKLLQTSLDKKNISSAAHTRLNGLLDDIRDGIEKRFDLFKRKDLISPNDSRLVSVASRLLCDELGTKLADESRLSADILKKIFAEVTANTLLSHTEIEIFTALLSEKMKAVAARLDHLDGQDLENWHFLEAKSREVGVQLDRLRAKFKGIGGGSNHPSSPDMPSDLNNLLSLFDSATSGNYVDPDPTQPPRRMLFNSPEYKSILGSLQGRLENFVRANPGVLIPEDINKLYEHIDVLRSRADFSERAQMVLDRNGDYRLDSMGIKGELKQFYKLLTGDQQDFEVYMQREIAEYINAHRSSGRSEAVLRQEANDHFAHKIHTGVKKFVLQALSIIDTDETQFSEHIFTSLVHEPIYNSLTQSLAGLSGYFRDIELKMARELRSGSVAKIHVTEFDPDSGRDGAWIRREKSLSELFDHLSEYVSYTKDQKSYAHNVYVLGRTNQWDKFAQYAHSVDTKRINDLFRENPAMGLAVNAHQAYLNHVLGLNGWKHVQHIYTVDPKTGSIPIDAYVREVLEQQTNLSSEERKHLATMAKGICLGTLQRTMDLNAGPGEGGLQLNEMYGPQNAYDKILLMRRFNMGGPFGKAHVFLWKRLGGKDQTGSKPYNEWVEANELMNLRKHREHSLIYSDEELERKGLAFLDMGPAILQQAGGLGKRKVSWRRNMLGRFNGKMKALADVEKLARVNPQAANALVEKEFGHVTLSDKAGIEARSAARKVVLDRLADIAPQAFISMDRDLIDLRYTDQGGQTSLREQFLGASGNAGEKLSDTQQQKLMQLVMDAETISQHLLNGLDAHGQPVLRDFSYLEVDDSPSGGKSISEKWFQAMFPNIPYDAGGSSPEVQAAFARVKETREFMLAIRNRMSDTIINKGYTHHVRLTKDDGSIQEFDESIVSWASARLINNFPAHYNVDRLMDYGKGGDRWVGRMVNDNATLAAGFDKWMGELGKLVETVQASGNRKMDESAYIPLTEAIKEYADSIKSVHGPESPEYDSASVHHASWITASMYIDWFNRDSLLRHIPAGQYMSRFSSWVSIMTGFKDSEIESQRARTIVNVFAKRGYIAPAHTVVYNPDPKGRKILGITMPSLHKAEFRRSPWNAADLYRHSGATMPSVILAMGESALPFAFVIGAWALLRAVSKEEQSH